MGERITDDMLTTKLSNLLTLVNDVTADPPYVTITLHHPSDGAGTYRATASTSHTGRGDALLGTLGGYLGRTKPEAAHTLDTIRWTLLAIQRDQAERRA